MVFELQYPRTITEQRPEGHQPAAPRYSLRWDKPHMTLVTVYFGMQMAEMSWDAKSRYFDFMRGLFCGAYAPEAHEIMQCKDEAGLDNAIVVAYWTDVTTYANWMATSGFRAWYADDERLSGSAGYWLEAIVVPYDRHETIYSAPNYRVGFGRTKGSEIVPITINGYYGAARDRLPLSAVDVLESPTKNRLVASDGMDGRGRRLLAAVPHNMTVLRSGQYWEGAGKEQLDDYRGSLQPKLLKGMDYLVQARETTGCVSMRIMTNVNENGSVRDETSVYAAFLSMAQLELWAKAHETHAEIYKHAIAMNRLYKEKREVVTWHELFVLQIGSYFEYVNCHAKTGILRYVPVMEVMAGR